LHFYVTQKRFFATARSRVQPDNGRPGEDVLALGIAEEARCHVGGAAFGVEND